MSNPADEVSGEEAWGRWCILTAGAYARYHEKLLSLRANYPELTDYAVVSRVAAASGTLAWHWGADSEVLETINSINAWGVRLHSWNAWNLVVESCEDENDKWEVLNHFVEPIAFFCMLQPSSLADRIAVVAETLLHQANQRVFPEQPDQLEQDNLPLGRTLRRSDRRKQLNTLGQPWTTYTAFRDALAVMDGKDYQKATRNFRDLTHHSFAPRLMVGDVTRAIRSIVPRQDLIEQPDGTFQEVENPTRKSVQYAMSSMQPLPLETTRAANLAEYLRARRTIETFATLINELCERMDAMHKQTTA